MQGLRQEGLADGLSRDAGERGPALGREVMGQLGSRAYPELPVDAAEVRLDGLRTEEEGGGHLLVGGALRDLERHLQLL